MYPSDYGYAASPDYWSYPFYSSSGGNYDYRAAINSNWLYLGSSEWTITPRSSSSFNVFSVYSYGNLINNNVLGGIAVRPVFYLKSNVALVDGVGSSSDPYRVAIA